MGCASLQQIHLPDIQWKNASFIAHSQSAENLAFVDIGFTAFRDVDPSLTSAFKTPALHWL